MKKIFAFALCAAILGACSAPAWASDSVQSGPHTVKAENGVAGKKVKKGRKHHKKKKGKKGRTANKGRHARKA